MVPPWSAYVLTAFGIAFGWILHRAAVKRVYRLTGLYFLDAYILVWLMGLASGFTPLCLYLAFGFKEFSATPDGEHYTTQLHRGGRAEVIFFVGYALFILTTVPQRSDHPITGQDILQVIVVYIASALVAILFTGLKGLLDRLK